MTQHNQGTNVKDVIDCRGCEYLIRNGLPMKEAFKDHLKEQPGYTLDARWQGYVPPKPKPLKTRMQCIECGAKFSRTIGPRTFEAKCPKCGGFDTEVA